jgi:hypothetical protein
MSGPEIKPDWMNEGAERAEDEFADAVDTLAHLFKSWPWPQVEMLTEHPMLVVGFALIARLDERAADRYIQKEAELETLSRIADGIEMISGSLMQLIVGELKERWLKSHQFYTEAELKEAMDYFDSMAVAGSGLKRNDK